MENENLFENFDFIEEATPFSTVPLEFQDVSELDISESKSEKSPYKLIGKVKGCMAPIGVYSRNHRLYENDHWIKTLANPILQEKLKNRSLYGMPSHMQKMIDDEDFREGRISHIVSCLEVREDNNGKPFLYGEFDILDTPAGRILKAMYEGGAGIYVSTRAAGRLLPIPGDSINKKVDSSSYFLGGIDCVLNPGFLQAKPAFEAVSTEVSQPQIHESHEEQLQPSPTNEEITILKSQIDKLAKIVEKVVDDVYEEPTSEAQDDDYEWSVVRKNALANPNLYGGRYTDKDANKAKKQYLEDKKNNFKITSEAQEEPKQKVLEPKPEEAPQMQEQPIAPVQKEKANEALADFVSLMASTNISEEKFSEILDIMTNSLKKESK